MWFYVRLDVRLTRVWRARAWRPSFGAVMHGLLQDRLPLRGEFSAKYAKLLQSWLTRQPE